VLAGGRAFVHESVRAGAIGRAGVHACVCEHSFVRGACGVRPCVRPCVRACVRACVPAFMRACVRAFVKRACWRVGVWACGPGCMRACVPVCVRACVRLCVCACARGRVRVRAGSRGRAGGLACLRTYDTCVHACCRRASCGCACVHGTFASTHAPCFTHAIIKHPSTHACTNGVCH
jgi:hypothetical protein